jgi:hypothetical protein
MESLNWKRIVGGGLVAGLVLILGEVAAEPLMGPRMEALFTRLGLVMPGESAMLAVVVSSIGLGITLVWLYAALGGVYRTTSRRVVTTAIAVWLLSCLLPSLTLYAYGIMTGEYFAFAATWPLVPTLIAALAGGRIYDGRRMHVGATSRA